MILFLKIILFLSHCMQLSTDEVTSYFNRNLSLNSSHISRVYPKLMKAGILAAIKFHGNYFSRYPVYKCIFWQWLKSKLTSCAPQIGRWKRNVISAHVSHIQTRLSCPPQTRDDNTARKVFTGVSPRSLVIVCSQWVQFFSIYFCAQMYVGSSSQCL